MEIKKSRLALIILPILYVIIFFLVINLDSSHATLESVRSDDDIADYYEGGVLIHTENAEGRYYDFIVNDGKFCVVEIRSKIIFGKEVYEPGLTSKSDFLYSDVNNDFYEENNTFRFFTTLPHELKFHPSKKQAFWCLMDDREVVLVDGMSAYPFEYTGKNYILYIKLEEVK